MNIILINKLYQTVSKCQVRVAQLGTKIYGEKRRARVKDPLYQEMLELDQIISLLLEPTYVILKDNEPYPNFLNMEDRELEKLLDYVTYTYNLKDIPYFDFANNVTTVIPDLTTIFVGGDGGGITLPQGGGVGFYLTKNINGAVVWEEVTGLNSSFADL